MSKKRALPLKSFFVFLFPPFLLFVTHNYLFSFCCQGFRNEGEQEEERKRRRREEREQARLERHHHHHRHFFFIFLCLQRGGTMFFLLFFLLRRKGSFQCRKPVCAALNAGGGGQAKSVRVRGVRLFFRRVKKIENEKASLSFLFFFPLPLPLFSLSPCSLLP